jgi:hypothetical protein
MKIHNSYTHLEGGQWLRGNLHTHTTRSDGKRPAQAVINDYAAHGYDFLMISDHDIFTSAKDLAAFDPRGMVLIPGNEITANGPHLLHVNAGSRVAPDPVRQDVINAVTASGQGFLVACHPDWLGEFNHISFEQLREWTGYEAIEVYNGAIRCHKGHPCAANKWDRILTTGRRVWGQANDDSHLDSDVGIGWNTVYARERTLPAIIEALRSGRFYASTGVVIRDIRVGADTIRVETENADRVMAIADFGRRIAQADGPVLEITIPDDVRYVRFEGWGRGEQIAWTQPFFVSQE